MAMANIHMSSSELYGICMTQQKVMEDIELHPDYEDMCKELNGKEIEKLKQQLDASSQVNAMMMKKWKELTTDQNLSEMVGLGKDTGTDVAIARIASEFIDLKKENEKLKEEIEKHKKNQKVYLSIINS